MAGDKGQEEPETAPHRASNKPRKGEFFVLDIKYAGGKGHGVIFENEEQLLTPPRRIIRPVDGGFPPLHERPRLRHVPKEGKLPRDLEGGMSGYWLVSWRLKQIFESVDPQGFAFAACDFTLADGSKGPQYYLCDVVRTLDALDEEASTVRIKIEPSGCKLYSFVGGAKLAFKKEKIGWAHVFRMPQKPSSTICDHVLRDACRAAGMNKKGGISGLQFWDAADY